MFVRGLPPPPTPRKHKACHGLIEWLDTELYLLLQPSILTTLLPANIKMDHTVYSHQVKCEMIWTPKKHINYLLFYFSHWEMHTSLHFTRTPGQLQPGQVSLEDILKVTDSDSVTTMSSHCPHFAPNFSVTHFSGVKLPIQWSKHHTNPYHYRRSFLIGSPLSSLSSTPLHETHKGTVIHHTPNLFCHFSLG